MIDFYVPHLAMTDIAFKKRCYQISLFTFAQLKIYCFKIWHGYYLYVGLQHIFSFLDKSEILVFTGIIFDSR